MSLIIKIILPVAIAIAAIWGYLTYVQPEPMQEAYVPAIHEPVPADQQAPVTDSASAEISGRDASDASLDADLGAIDSQLQAASQSSAAVDAGVNDKAGDTSY